MLPALWLICKTNTTSRIQARFVQYILNTNERLYHHIARLWCPIPQRPRLLTTAKGPPPVLVTRRYPSRYHFVANRWLPLFLTADSPPTLCIRRDKSVCPSRWCNWEPDAITWMPLLPPPTGRPTSWAVSTSSKPLLLLCVPVLNIPHPIELRRSSLARPSYMVLDPALINLVSLPLHICTAAQLSQTYRVALKTFWTPTRNLTILCCSAAVVTRRDNRQKSSPHTLKPWCTPSKDCVLQAT